MWQFYFEQLKYTKSWRDIKMKLENLYTDTDYQASIENYIYLAKKEIKRCILPKIVIKKYRIDKIYRKTNYLGYYQVNSVFNKPIIKLNVPTLAMAGIEYNLPLYDIVLSTILHELGHAIQELKHKNFNEIEAEDFAYNYCRLGKINKI